MGTWQSTSVILPMILLCLLLLWTPARECCASPPADINQLSAQANLSAGERVTLSGLVGYWNFDEGSGNVAHDSSGYLHHGTIYGGATWGAGISGRGLQLDGVDDYVEVPNASDLNPTTAITLSAWYKPVSFVGTGNDPIIDKGYSSHTTPYYQYHLGAVGNDWNPSYASGFTFNAAISGVRKIVPDPEDYPTGDVWVPGSWYHVAAAYDGTYLSLYVNGVLLDRLDSPAPGTMQDYGKNLFFGRFSNLAYFLPGTLDEITIYERALAPLEVQELYEAMCDPLTDQICEVSAQSPHWRRFNQTSPRWAGVAINSSSGDKQISIYDACDSGILLGDVHSSYATDFLVGDFNHTPPGARGIRFADAGADYFIEWNGGEGEFPMNAAVVGHPSSVDSCQMMRVWDLPLRTDKAYQVFCQDSYGGTDDPIVATAILGSPAGSLWKGRSDVLMNPTWGDFLAPIPSADRYGLVLYCTQAGIPLDNTWLLIVESDPAPLEEGTCRSDTGVPLLLHLDQQISIDLYFVVAVAPAATDDKNLELYRVRIPPPGGGDLVQIGTSDWGSGTDFMLGMSTGVGYYCYVNVVGGSASAPFTTTWLQSRDHPLPLDTWGVGSLGGGPSTCKVAKPYLINHYFSSGTGYDLNLERTAGSADVRAALFGRDDVGSWQARSRGDARWEAGAGAPYYFIPSESMFYYVVVFNDSPGLPSADYRFKIRESGCQALVNGTCVTSSTDPQWLGFRQDVPTWIGVAVQPMEGQNKDIGVNTLCGGGGATLAFSDVAGTDYVVADFNHNPLDAYFPRVSQGGTSTYAVELEGASDIYSLGLPDSGDVGLESPCSVIKVHDVSLSAGHDYRLTLTSVGADIRAALFASHPEVYWFGRDAAVFEKAASATPYVFHVSVTDQYGLVVFNNSPLGSGGSYVLKIDDVSPSGLPELADEVGPIRLWVPNPFRVGASIRLAVVQPAFVRLEIYDVQGNRVRCLKDGQGTAVEEEIVWDGTDDRGRSLGSGVFFLRATAGLCHLEQKFTMLR